MREGGSYIVPAEGGEPVLVERTRNPVDGQRHELPAELGGNAPDEEVPAAKPASSTSRRARAAEAAAADTTHQAEE